jgi:hypothetical protein
MEPPKNLKRLPYGLSNFETIRTENYVYVDKTRYIELLENESNHYHFFIRPRKFGKSLFLSILMNYYDVNRKHLFEQLFGDLYIGRNPTPRRNSYLIIWLNFSGINTQDVKSFSADFNLKIKIAVSAFLSDYDNIFPDTDRLERNVDNTESGSVAMEMAYGAAMKAGKKIFVIIDEYDHFANDLIAMGTRHGENIYHSMIHANGLVRDFYETLKIGTSKVVSRIFITGISPVMLDDLTSGFNIAGNLSLDLKYNEMMGFTQAEVSRIIDQTGIQPSWIQVDMESYYNGYLFHRNGENRLYNPSMIHYFFDMILREQKPPEQIMDDNLKTDYGRLQRLVQNDCNREKLLEIAKNGNVVSDIISKFSIDRLNDDEYFISLLFYMGLLTIDRYEAGNLFLKIPNYTIRTIYWEYIERLTREWNSDVAIDTAGQRKAIWELAFKGDPHPYIKYVSQNIFSRLSNRDLERFDEKYIKIMLLNGLFQSRLFVPVSEKEVEGGYIDIYLQRSPLLPEIPDEWVWEIKYVRAGDGRSEKALQTHRREARRQLEKYRNARLFAGRADVRYLSILFVGKDRFETEEI